MHTCHTVVAPSLLLHEPHIKLQFPSLQSYPFNNLAGGAGKNDPVQYIIRQCHEFSLELRFYRERGRERKSIFVFLTFISQRKLLAFSRSIPYSPSSFLSLLFYPHFHFPPDFITSKRAHYTAHTIVSSSAFLFSCQNMKF